MDKKKVNTGLEKTKNVLCTIGKVFAKIGNIILSAEGVVDYDNLTVNGGYNRVDVPDKSVAVLGSVVLNVE